MKKTVLTLLLAGILAWCFGPFLLNELTAVGPILKEFGSIFTLFSLIWRGPGFFLQFLVAIIVFWFLLKAIGMLFSFALPKSQRYGTTKFLRRVQGFSAEIILVLSAFLMICFCVFVFTGRYESYVELISELWLPILVGAIVLYLPANRSLKRMLACVYTAFLLRVLEPGRFGDGGSARFGGLVEEWSMRYSVRQAEHEDALFIGRSLYDRLLHIGSRDDRHMLTIGGTRGGKGTAAIIPNLLLWKGSALVIDPKGTNAEVTAKRRQDMGQQIYVIDPFEVLGAEFYQSLNKKGPDAFNPLKGLDINSLTIREDLGVVADALVVSDTVHRDPHWDDGARTISSGLMAHLLSDAEYQNQRSLTTLRDLLALQPEDLDRLWASMSLNREAGEWARDAATRIIRGIHTDEIQNILSNVDKHTEWLGSKGIRNVLTKAPEEPENSKSIFAKLKEEPTTIYLVVPPRFLDIHRRFLRLVINLALNEMSRSEKQGHKVLMMLDEFQQLGKMPEIVKAYRLLAGYNFTLWIFAQDWAGMTELYGNEANTFLSNSRAIQVFSLNDAVSLELISRQIGMRSKNGGLGVSVPQTAALRMPDEVSKEIARQGGKQYLLRAGAAPLVLEKVMYYEDNDSYFARLLSPKQRFWRPESMETRTTLMNPFGNVRETLMHLLYPFRGLYAIDPDYQGVRNK
ncbi:MAG TPA: type IV secretory system conjugative DNA transfer family protein [Pyrinomonadaceae bacterium]|nr:type IV secretory system conjugative DNA transfer family protein [Pyrinomonadaceae bacterium]